MTITLGNLESVAWAGSWGAIEPDDRNYFERELVREICETHALAGEDVTAIAQGGNGDDIVFFVHSSPPRLAVVHLTYCKTRETSPAWPSTGIYHFVDELLIAIEDI